MLERDIRFVAVLMPTQYRMLGSSRDTNLHWAFSDTLAVTILDKLMGLAFDIARRRISAMTDNAIFINMREIVNSDTDKDVVMNETIRAVKQIIYDAHDEEYHDNLPEPETEIARAIIKAREVSSLENRYSDWRDIEDAIREMRSD